MKKKIMIPNDLINNDYGSNTLRMSESEQKASPLFATTLENFDATQTGMNRRTFLSLMGASVALAGVAGCRRPEEHIVPFVSKPENETLGLAKQFATSMPFGTENYSLLATSHEGRPTKVAGNALNGCSGTSTNVWANASILGLYDPDRSQEVVHEGKPVPLSTFEEAWKTRHAEYLLSGGEGLAILSESFASPTLDRLRREFHTKFPHALWATFEAVCDENMLIGMETAFGKRLHAVHHIENADVILALDADFLGTETRQYAHARAFAQKRKVEQPNSTMNRLYVVESSLSQSSVMADHRLGVPHHQIVAFTIALLDELHSLGLNFHSLRLPITNVGFDSKWVRALAKDLMLHKGKSLVIAGRKQPPIVHALVTVLNHALENSGKSVTYSSLPFASYSSISSLRILFDRANAGKVSTLVLLGGNPVFNLPMDFNFATLLEKIPNRIQHAIEINETTERCTWHLPRTHFLEAWGDISSIDGHLGIIQPLIAPLYDGLSEVEMLALLSSGTMSNGFDAVRETWKSFAPTEKAFNRILHDGIFAHPIASEAVAPDLNRISTLLETHFLHPITLSRNNLEIVFQPSPTIFDGRFANNGWLQEFPDPVTKLTWDNAAVMSKVTAENLGVKNEDLIRISLGKKDTVLPVWILPGQADFTITLNLGYGRRCAGRVGTGVGFNVYPLRSSSAMYSTIGARISKLNKTYRLACVQDHHGLDDEKLAADGIKERLPVILPVASLAEYNRHPEFVERRIEMPKLQSMFEDHMYDTGHQWGMSIDLNACIGCGSCTVACQSENNIPIVGKELVLNGREMHWIRIDRYFSGTLDAPTVMTQPIACVHCEMAPCEQVCPVAATSHDDEGLNVMTYNRCIGTRYCSNNCPYKARRFNFFNYTKDLPETVQMAQNPEVTVRFRGVMEKCTYCTQRINLSKIAAKRENRPLKDGDIITACEEACPTQAIVFGDTRDMKSRVAALKSNDRDYAVLGELNLRPRTTFLAKLRNPNPELEGDT